MAMQNMLTGNSKFRSAIFAKLQGDAAKPASERWKEAYKAAMTTTKGDPSKALKEVDKRFPGLRAEMISDANKR